MYAIKVTKSFRNLINNGDDTTIWPEHIQYALVNYCRNTQLISRDNDRDEADANGAIINGYLSENPLLTENMLATIKAARGEIRSILEFCLENKMFGYVSDTQAAILAAVLHNQGHLERFNASQARDFPYPVGDTIAQAGVTDLFEVAVQSAKGLVPQLQSFASVTRIDGKPELELGLRYNGCAIPRHANIAAPTFVAAAKALGLQRQ